MTGTLTAAASRVARRVRSATGRPATATGAAAGRDPQGPLAHHAGLLPRRTDRVVAVLADGTTRLPIVRQYLRGLPHDRVTVLGGDPTVVHRLDEGRDDVGFSSDDDVSWFVTNGPVDIVIDLRHPRSGGRRARWSTGFLFLRARGAWVVPRQNPSGDIRASERAWLTALARGVGAATTARNGDTANELLRAVAGVTARPGILVIEKRLDHVVKLHDDEVETVLPRRDPDVRVETIHTLPAQVFESSTRVVSHESSVEIDGLETTIAVPRMSVRHYRGPVAFAGSTLMFTQNSVLADSFRFYHALDTIPIGMANKNLYNLTPRLARPRPERLPQESLEGDYYQLDPQTTGHFGHITTEMIARLWGWDVAKERLPHLKALLWAEAPAPAEPAGGVADPAPAPVPGQRVDAFAQWRRPRLELERTLLTAYGIPDEDIVVVDRPCHVHSLVSATMMWHNWQPYFVHPAIGEVWDRIAANVIDRTAPTYDKIFVSRPQEHWRRRCENGPEVEAFFAAHGFTIVYPERHSFGEQAAMFAAATAIAGYGGSGLFNAMFARNVRTIIIINQEGYTARNEHLFTAVLGCEVHYFWSTAVHVHPESQWWLGAYQSEFVFDFARNEAPLAELLRSLDDRERPGSG